MIDRRQFLTAIAVVLAGGLISGDKRMGFAATGNRVATLPTMVVYDARTSASCAFARSACLSGMSAVELKADVGELWYNAIGPTLRRVSHNLTGLTLASDLFLLKLLAADLDMKVLQETPRGSSGSLVFWVIAGPVNDATL